MITPRDHKFPTSRPFVANLPEKDTYIPAVTDAPAAVSEALLRRVATLAPILFQLIILCVYLHRTVMIFRYIG